MQKQSVDFIISPSNNKVVYIHSSLFMMMPNTIKFVSDLHGENCGVYLKNICQQNPCNTTLALYIDIDNINIDNTKLTPPTIENKFYKYIVAFLTVEIHENYGEIYNVCTSKHIRGKGVMKTLLKSVLKDIPLNRLWLGVDLKNPIIDAVIQLYVSVGFNILGIQNITPANNFPKFPFISLSYEKGNLIDRSPNIITSEVNRGYQMVNEYIRSGGFCQTQIQISSELINDINELYITKNVEFGGILGAKQIEGNKYLLGLAARTKGNKITYKINVPSYYITWHTHPFICYTKHKCYIGWPSGQDMGRILEGYLNGEIAHVLFSNEGIYFIQLSPEMMLFSRVLTESCIKDIVTIVKYFFSNLEEYRKSEYDKERLVCLDETKDPQLCLSYDTRQKHLSIQKITNIINTATLYELMSQYTIYDDLNKIIQKGRKCIEEASVRLNKNIRFPIFRVKYISMKDGLKDGVNLNIQYLMAPFRSSCPIPVYQGTDINYGGEVETMLLESNN